jgi:epsilon-lactone hydrolase
MQLPIFQTVQEILDYCWTRRRVAINHGAIPMAVVVAANLTGWLMGFDLTDYQSPAFAVLNLVNAVVFLPFTVTWYRMVILGQDAMTGRGLFTFSDREGRLFGWQVAIILIVAVTAIVGILVIGAIIGALAAANAALAQALSAVFLGIWAVLVVAVACRLSLVLAMAATDRPAVLSEAWARTKGLGGHMAAIFILCFFCAILLMMPLQVVAVISTFILGALSESLATSAEVVLSTIVGAFGSMMVLLFPTTLFAFVYNRISESMSGDQNLNHAANDDAEATRTHDTPGNIRGQEDGTHNDVGTEQDLTDEIEVAIQKLAGFMDGKPNETAADIRLLMDGLGASFPMPSDTTVEDIDADGVPARWVTAAGSDADRAILLLHGGGFTAGSLTSHQRLAADLSMACGTRVLLVDYRLAPEHPFPAGLEDCLTAYQWLLSQGFKPGHLAIAGDSAGGGLTISTALCLKDDGIDQPAALIALSPWVNLACDGETMDSKAKHDPIATQDGLLRCARDYLNGHDDKDPFVSPAFADLRGLPPILIQVGTREILLDDSRKLAVRARADDVPVRLEEWPGQIHDWHVMTDWMADARRALGGIATFVRRYMG